MWNSSEYSIKLLSSSSLLPVLRTLVFFFCILYSVYIFVFFHCNWRRYNWTHAEAHWPLCNYQLSNEHVELIFREEEKNTLIAFAKWIKKSHRHRQQQQTCYQNGYDLIIIRPCTSCCKVVELFLCCCIFCSLFHCILLASRLCWLVDSLCFYSTVNSSPTIYVQQCVCL